MKKIIFLFALLASMTASAAVTVTPLSVDYATKKVTFRVSWTGSAANNRVWVWVDLCPVSGTSPGTFAKAVISSPSVTAGNIAEFNQRGFYVNANPTTVTTTLDNATGKFNWCVYGSDMPPNIGDYDNGVYTLRGTPPFTLYDENSTTQIITGTTIARSSLNIEPITMTDATGCPGNFCKYVGSDLHMNATTYKCQQRTSGAKNWEAWIKDTRDNELYRIVFMPDNKWWLAQNVKYAGTGSAVSGCTKDECGWAYTWAQTYASYAGGSSGFSGIVQGICPPGWLLPIRATFAELVASLGGVVAASAHMRANNSTCSPRTNGYGWANKYGLGNGYTRNDIDCFYTNDEGREDGVIVDGMNAVIGAVCNNVSIVQECESTDSGTVRCFRQL
jgi:uncharacterized protein (TIGR02145 family)